MGICEMFPNREAVYYCPKNDVLFGATFMVLKVEFYRITEHKGELITSSITVPLNAIKYTGLIYIGEL